LDEAIALPTDYSAKIARNTQIILQQESGICDVVIRWEEAIWLNLLQQMIEEA
jgi:methylmalonyl-CoA mutase